MEDRDAKIFNERNQKREATKEARKQKRCEKQLSRHSSPFPAEAKQGRI